MQKIAQIPFEDTRGGGYKFGQKVRGKINTYHPGRDANQGASALADEGLPVKVMAAGIVVYARSAGSGWGNLVVIEHPELGKLWPTGYIASRYAHLKQIHVKVGDKVDMTNLVGLCGRTGTKSPHSHREVIQKKLPSYTHYPNNKGLDYVKEYWTNPDEFIPKINELALPQIPEYAEDAVAKAVQKMVAQKWNNPNEVIGDATVEQIFINLGVLDKKEGNITKARFIVALDRLGILD